MVNNIRYINKMILHHVKKFSIEILKSREKEVQLAPPYRNVDGIRRIFALATRFCFFQG